ncbi:TAF10 [Cordylochernes scorpioides]|uniref:TAF10 n=1 Tax=Cordylochernes scorpioides TaxID=51811 RepID=A0ABY6L2N3_9ARAC|nr:TAF10 [Cordylochernes scorpioides]
MNSNSENVTTPAIITTTTSVQNVPKPASQTLADFFVQLETYNPTIPDAVTTHFLNSAGFETSDVRIVRLISLASQKFISDIANEALQSCKMKNIGAAKKPKERQYTLTMDDLSSSLSEHGISVKKPFYFN